MPERRPLLLNGLRVTLSRPGALLWTYAINLGLALLFSLRLHEQLADLLNHSLASQRLTTGFDLGTLIPALQRLSNRTPASGSVQFASIPLYLAIYFVLIPGTLFSYLTGAPARLGILLGEGLAFFWRFMRITLLTLLISAIFLVPLVLAQNAWTDWLTGNRTGAQVYYLQIPGVLLIVLVACLLRLYFDLVEVYTVQLGQWPLASGRPDRRVLQTLKPAFRALCRNFGRVYFSFILLAAAGLAAMLLLTRIAVHMLAQPRAWPMFLLAQIGLLLMLLTRFWQRGAETILAQDYPVLLPAVVEAELVSAAEPTRIIMSDPLPDPEPIAPSLPEADPGIYRRNQPEQQPFREDENHQE